MASYEFGVMDPGPLPGVRYDAYEPEKYRCIPVRAGVGVRAGDPLEQIGRASCRERV